jgi:hypothetical protein
LCFPVTIVGVTKLTHDDGSSAGHIEYNDQIRAFVYVDQYNYKTQEYWPTLESALYYALAYVMRNHSIKVPA